MEKNSYVKLDELYEIPVENLRLAGSAGRQYELQSKSWDQVSNFISMNPRPTRVMNIRDPAAKEASWFHNYKT